MSALNSFQKMGSAWDGNDHFETFWLVVIIFHSKVIIFWIVYWSCTSLFLEVTIKKLIKSPRKLNELFERRKRLLGANLPVSASLPANDTSLWMAASQYQGSASMSAPSGHRETSPACHLRGNILSSQWSGSESGRVSGAVMKAGHAYVY